MNHDLEERLTQHLSSQVQSDSHDPQQLADVRKRAWRRSLRNRVTAGIVALVAIAGLGALVPTSDEPSALITATQPIPSPTAPERPRPAPDDLQNGGVAPDETSNAEFAGPAQTLNLVGDGQGGFVGVGSSTDPAVLNFVRSDDGESWRTAESWAIPAGARLHSLIQLDGLFVAVLDQSAPGARDYAVAIDPLVAVSPDLQSWDFIDLDLSLHSGVGGGAAEVASPGEREIRNFFTSFARNGDKLGMLVATLPRFDPAVYALTLNQVCGEIRRPGRGALILCDGDLAELRSSDVGRYLHNAERRVFVSGDGGPATPIDIQFPPQDVLAGFAASPTLIASSDGFVVVTPSADIATVLSPESLVAGLIGEAFSTEPTPDVTVVTAHTGADGVMVAVIRVGDKLVPIRVAPEGATTSTAVGAFPLEIRQILADELRLTEPAHGPGGWVIGVDSFQGLVVIEEQNGWSFRSVAGSPSAVLVSASRDETIIFDVNSALMPPNVEVSLFGGVRYTHPETGELLVELSAAESLVFDPWAAAAGQVTFDRTLSSNGWELGGDPLAGPLTLTSPDGLVRTFNDGFAFDNEDISDGVETDIGSDAFREGVLPNTGLIRFYDEQGLELAAFRARHIIEQLITPVVEAVDGFQPAVADHRPTTMILHSADGLEWSVLFTSNQDSPAFLNTPAVGDDEVLVATSSTEILRIPIDE